MIEQAFSKNQFKAVLKLCRDFDNKYPLEHEQIVSNMFLVAKIHCQNKRIDQGLLTPNERPLFRLQRSQSRRESRGLVIPIER